jgi:hypothetical protein
MEKQIQHDNFIGIYDGFFTPEYCNSLIKYHEWCRQNNRTFGRKEYGHNKKDTAVCLDPYHPYEVDYAAVNIGGYMDEFNNCFWQEAYKDYMDTYSVLRDHSEHTIFSYKIQRTDPGEGYHMWHCENGDKQFMRRLGVYLLYLNDVEEGGETEFLYLSKRVQPKQGRLLIFPPNYPWAHRGNPPLSGSKYIMTGWLELS